MIFTRRKKKQLNKLKSNFGNVKNEGFNFDLIQRYFEQKDNSDSFQTLKDDLLADLDFDLFFAYVDRTNSKVGQQFLYNSMRNIQKERKSLQEQEELINYFQDHPNERLTTQYLISKLNHKNAYYLSDLFQKEHIEIPRWFFIIPLLSLTAVLSIVLSFFYAKYFLIFLAIIPINILIHFFNKRRVNVYVSTVPLLLTLNSIAKKLINFPFLKERSEKVKQSSKNIDQLKRRMSFFKLEQKVDSDLEVVYWFLLEVFKISFLIEPLLIQSVVRKLETKRVEIEDVFSYVGQIDQAISVLSLRQSQVTCLPTICDSLKDLNLTNIIHPLIPDCVPNSVNDANKPYLLTGSNMAGKTTFIRAVGLNVISGLTINTCFGESCSFPCLKVHSVIRISDDLSTARSYFHQEALSIKTLIEESTQEHENLFLLDELFKGTNAVERISSAKAILSHLAQPNSFVLASTHDIELTELLKKQYYLCHFEGSLIDNEIQYDYKLKTGPAMTSNAIDILKIMNYPESVITESEELVKKMNQERQSPSL